MKALRYVAVSFELSKRFKTMTKSELKAQAKEVVETTKSMTDKSLEKAQAAADDTAKLATKSTKVFEDTASILKAGAADWQVKLFEMTKANLDANFAFAQELLGANTPVEAFAMQKRFAEDRMAAMQEQTAQLGALASKVAEDVVKPAQDGIIKSFDEAKKAFAA